MYVHRQDCLISLLEFMNLTEHGNTGQQLKSNSAILIGECLRTLLHKPCLAIRKTTVLS